MWRQEVRCDSFVLTRRLTVAVKIAKARGFQPKGGMPPNLVSLDQGIATHVFACFEPSLAGVLQFII